MLDTQLRERVGSFLSQKKESMVDHLVSRSEDSSVFVSSLLANEKRDLCSRLVEAMIGLVGQHSYEEFSVFYQEFHSKVTLEELASLLRILRRVAVMVIKELATDMNERTMAIQLVYDDVDALLERIARIGEKRHVEILEEAVKKRTRELQEAQEKYKKIIERSVYGVYVLQDDAFKLVNEVLCSMLGYKEEELLGMDYRDLLTEEQIPEIESGIFKRQQGIGPPARYELKAKRKDGSFIDLEVYSTPVTFEGRSAIQGTVRDLTEEKLARKLRTSLLMNISHELRTPLTAVIGYVKFLLTEKAGKLTVKQRRYLEIVEEEGEKLDRLIDELLDLSAIEATGLQVKKEDVDVAGILSKTISTHYLEAREKGLSIQSEVPENIGTIEGDVLRIDQLFSNLLSNAIRFTPGGGAITVRARRENGEISVHFEDTGIGIPKEEIPRIFERFYQVDSTLSRKYHGAGIGLAICDEIVKAHGGRIEVESEEGKGSVFKVFLPMNKKV